MPNQQRLACNLAPYILSLHPRRCGTSLQCCSKPSHFELGGSRKQRNSPVLSDTSLPLHYRVSQMGAFPTESFRSCHAADAKRWALILIEALAKGNRVCSCPLSHNKGKLGEDPGPYPLPSRRAFLLLFYFPGFARGWHNLPLTKMR